jgi:hypothetical protein
MAWDEAVTAFGDCNDSEIPAAASPDLHAQFARIRELHRAMQGVTDDVARASKLNDWLHVRATRPVMRLPYHTYSLYTMYCFICLLSPFLDRPRLC